MATYHAGPWSHAWLVCFAAVRIILARVETRIVRNIAPLKISRIRTHILTTKTTCPPSSAVSRLKIYVPSLITKSKLGVTAVPGLTNKNSANSMKSSRL